MSYAPLYLAANPNLLEGRANMANSAASVHHVNLQLQAVKINETVLPIVDERLLITIVEGARVKAGGQGDPAY